MNVRLRRPKSGFTLIELLIVIVIIGILATLGLVAYSYALRNGRNARRISDLNSMQSAFEQYYTQTSAYAACATMAGALQGGIPTDPNSGSYSSSCSASTYCICAALEPRSGAAGSAAVKGGNATTTGCAAASFTTNGSGAYYCVQARQ